MARVLVVDDSPLDRHRAGGLLKKHGDLEPVFATGGEDALRIAAATPVDVVVTDLQMPGMDGLALVEALRAAHPRLPVVLMTAHGSEEIAVRALQGGASSYVPKRNLARDLVDTVTSVLEVAREAQGALTARGVLERIEARYVLGTSIEPIGPLVRHLERDLVALRLVLPQDLVQVGVALREALVNAVEHGSLELDSAQKESDPQGYTALGHTRRALAPYRDRKVRVTVTTTDSAVRFQIRDEGPGFDPKTLPDPEDLANLERAYGRGLLLIRTFMDEVHHNAEGNEITLVKHATPVPSA
jgi:CheY-like chemotaxis protein/anti-sigma regulatory factor (Ser/Thr protein kinase)